MVTVDDLVISLTIKETGKLGKLQKQLDSLVGKSGRSGIPRFATSLMYIKRDLNTIKSRMSYLMPTEIPGEGRPHAMAIAAKTAHDLIGVNIKKYAEKFMSSKQGVQKNIAKALGIKTEDLQDFFEGKLRDYQYRLENIISGSWTTPSAQKFLANIDDMILRGDMEIGERKVLFNNIEASISEFNSEVAQLLERLGIFAIPEFSVFKMTEDVLEAIGGGGSLRLDMDRLLKHAGITGDPKAEKFYEEIKRISNMSTFTDPVKFIEQAFSKLGIKKGDITKKMFTKAGVKADPRLKAMIPSIIQVAARGGDTSGILKGFAQVVKEVVLKSVKEDSSTTFEQFYKYVRPDLMIISDEVEKLTDLFGPDIAKQITTGFFEFSEFKKVLTQQNADQFIKYETFVGKRLIGLASSIQDSFKRYVPDVLTKALNIMSELAKAGAITKLTDVQKEDLIKVATEGLTQEDLLNRIDIILKAMGTAEKERKEILSGISGIKTEKGKEPEKKITPVGSDRF